MRRSTFSLLVACAFAAPAAAQVPDHLQCYKIKDPIKLKGLVDLASPQFGTSGCLISKAKLFCVPASKSVVSAANGATPITPLEFWAAPAPGDRVRYKVRCPGLSNPADTQVTDQFGTRTLGGFRSSLVCTPAVKGAAPDAEQFHAFPATGQTTCWNAGGTVIPCAGTGQDGDIEPGSTLAHVDNGDGTITDFNTGLMWEKISDDGSIHDKDNVYNWDQAFTLKIAGLNSTAFAGYTDWRVPSAKELQSVVNYEAVFPAVTPVFNAGCAPSCSVTTCSCTASTGYWSSSTYVGFPTNAWYVHFNGGDVFSGGKIDVLGVRGVRGGS